MTMPCSTLCDYAVTLWLCRDSVTMTRLCNYAMTYVLWPYRVVPSVTMPWLCDYAVTLWLCSDSVTVPWLCDYAMTYVLWPYRDVRSVTMPWLCDYAVTYVLWLCRDVRSVTYLFTPLAAGRCQVTGWTSTITWCPTPCCWVRSWWRSPTTRAPPSTPAQDSPSPSSVSVDRSASL